MSIIEKAAKRLAEKKRLATPSERAGLLDLLTGAAGPVAEPPGTDPDAGYEPEPSPAESGERPADAAAGVRGDPKPGSHRTASEASDPRSLGDAQTLLPETRPPPSDAAPAAHPVPDVWPEADSGGSDEGIINVTRLDQALILSPDGGKSRTAEEFRVIKRPLLVNAFNKKGSGDRHANLIMVTSAIQGEGKTFLSLNLAVSIAMEMDSTVLLVDADVAKPGLSKLLGVDQRPGLIEHLTDEHSELADLLLRTDIPKLTVLPAGERHKKSTELLASNNMQRLLNELASRYSDRIVLFDSPPLLESTEAGVLASQMGQVAMVVASQATSQVLVKEALSQFDSLDNVNLVLNKCKETIFSGKYGSYGYGYGYYGQKDSAKA